MSPTNKLETTSQGPVDIDAAFAGLAFLADRRPTTQRDDYFATLSGYRDGAIFIAHYAGTSEWERHGSGDEIVMVLDGATTIILRMEDADVRYRLGERQFIVVPHGVWHRFETPHGVKVLSVTPQPTDHTAHDPNERADVADTKG
ncbi:MAG: cupin domain-containing protein [Acidimicrobiia bacterium]